MRRKEKENGQQLEEDEGEHQCEEEDRFSITELCCLSHFFIPLKRESDHLMNPAGENEGRKDFDPCAFCGRHLVQAVDLNSFWSLDTKVVTPPDTAVFDPVSIDY